MEKTLEQSGECKPPRIAKSGHCNMVAGVESCQLYDSYSSTIIISVYSYVSYYIYIHAHFINIVLYNIYFVIILYLIVLF